MSTEEKTVRLIATVRQIHGPRLLLPGDEFLSTEMAAKQLVRMHFASLAVVDEPLKRRQYRRRDMTAEGTTETTE